MYPTHLSLQERADLGNGGRDAAPLSAHARWRSTSDRRDPNTLLEQQDADREPDLIPTRYGRMMVSPFTFYRGAAKIMAADLGGTPRAGLMVQLSGDAHLSNFGLFGSPERKLVFDVNDFDETLPGPFEYDVKRMAASFTIAARNNGIPKTRAHEISLASVTAYREAMAGFAGMRTMDVWYAHLSEDDLNDARTAAKTKQDRRAVKRIEREVKKARIHDSVQALSKLGELVDGQYRIVSDPPIVVPARDLTAIFRIQRRQIERQVHEQFHGYLATVPDDRRNLLERFRVVDVARKAVGVGSVGTRAYIVLLQGRDRDDPLFLQVKQATRSVLEDHLPKSGYKSSGERVVQGQRMIQAVSDVFLGWYSGRDGRHYYWRQLRDMKGSAMIETMTPSGLERYANICAWTLARAHARSGDPVAIAAYLGLSDRFDRAIARFSERYADQNERDYDAFVGAVRSGRLHAVEAM
jgi:uncharacterized protein (DUF2252 family)